MDRMVDQQARIRAMTDRAEIYSKLSEHLYRLGKKNDESRYWADKLHDMWRDEIEQELLELKARMVKPTVLTYADMTTVTTTTLSTSPTTTGDET